MNLQNKKTQNIIGIIVLLMLVALALLKWVLGWCSIWLCVIFGGIVVAWSIISDSTTHEKPSEESQNDTKPPV